MRTDLKIMRYVEVDEIDPNNKKIEREELYLQFRRVILPYNRGDRYEACTAAYLRNWQKTLVLSGRMKIVRDLVLIEEGVKQPALVWQRVDEFYELVQVNGEHVQ